MQLCTLLHACLCVISGATWCCGRPLHLTDRKQLNQRRKHWRATQNNVFQRSLKKPSHHAHTLAQSGFALQPSTHERNTVHLGSTLDISHSLSVSVFRPAKVTHTCTHIFTQTELQDMEGGGATKNLNVRTLSHHWSHSSVTPCSRDGGLGGRYSKTKSLSPSRIIKNQRLEKN